MAALASASGAGASGGMSAPDAGELPYSKTALTTTPFPAGKYADNGETRTQLQQVGTPKTVSRYRTEQVLYEDEDDLAMESVDTASDSEQGLYDTDSVSHQTPYIRRSSYPITVYSSGSVSSGWPSPTSSPEKVVKSVGSSGLRHESSHQELAAPSVARASSWGGGPSSSLISEDESSAMNMGMTLTPKRASAVGRNSLSFDAPPLTSSLKAEAFDYLATEDIQPYPNARQQVHKTLSSLQTAEWPEIFHTLNSVSC